MTRRPRYPGQLPGQESEPAVGDEPEPKPVYKPPSKADLPESDEAPTAVAAAPAAAPPAADEKTEEEVREVVGIVDRIRDYWNTSSTAKKVMLVVGALLGIDLLFTLPGNFIAFVLWLVMYVFVVRS